MLNQEIKLTEKSPDIDLIEGCLRFDARAQEFLYRRWFGEFLGISLRYTGDREEAIDVLNRAFLKIFESMQNYRPQEGGTFSGWMARIVFNTTIDYARSQSRYRKRYDFNVEKEQSIENEALGKLAAEDIFKLVQKLPPTTRTVFSLFALDGYKHAEIAKLLKIGEATSRWHVGQARKTLRKLVVKKKLFYLK